MLDYEKIKSNLKNSSPKNFLINVLSCPKSDDFFTFSQSINNQFKKNCLFLASEETITEKNLLDWEKNEFLVVCQTIDGDYITGLGNQTLVIPASLYKSDIEYFNLLLCDFFIAYSQNKIHSKILPTISF